MLRSLILFSICILALHPIYGQSYQIAVLKYEGGGDYYANPTSLPNLVQFANKELKTTISKDVPYVEVGSTDLFNYPFVHMTGHGNVVFSGNEVQNLRLYLESGGFLHVSDNYGMDQYVRREMKKVFPDLEFVELSFDHPVFHQKFNFPNGLPKIHEHDKKAPQAFGIFIEDRLAVFYDFECDLGDGWEDEEVHHDAAEKRIQALKMGANLIHYAFTRFLN